MASGTQTFSSNRTPEISTWNSVKRGLRASGVPWLFIAPSIIVMLVITFYPQAYQIYISFFDFKTENLTGAPATFVGLKNFQDVLISGLNVPNYNFFPLLGFNIMWTLVNVFFHVVIGVAVAMALNAKFILGRKFYRTMFLIPWALPAYISSLIWNNLWQKNGGGVNLLADSLNKNLGLHLPTQTDWLGDLNPPVDFRGIIPLLVILFTGGIALFLIYRLYRNGLTGTGTRKGKWEINRVVWYGGSAIILGATAIFTLVDVLNGSTASFPVIQLFDRAGAPVLAFYAVLVANIWLGWPFMMVVATGALQSIPPDLYEAAEVDGADKWHQFRSITVPLIRPAMVPAIMLGTIWTFNQFSVIFFITGGGPRNQTDLLITQAYKLIQQEQLYGAAAAFSLVVFFILLIITIINNRVTRATEAYDA